MFGKKTKNIRTTFSQNVLIAWFRKKKAKACEELQAGTEVEVKAKDKTEGMTDANSFDTVNDGKRGVSPAEMLRLIDKAEEKRKKQDQARSGKETRIQVEQKARCDLGEKVNTYEDLMAKIESEAKCRAKKAETEIQAVTEVKEKAISYAKAKAETEKKLKAQTRASAEAEKKLKAEIQARQRADQKAKTERQARIKAEKKAKSYAKAKAETEKQLKAQTQARIKVEKKLKAEVHAKHRAEGNS